MALTTLSGVPYGPTPRTDQAGRGVHLSWPPRMVVIHDTGNPNSSRGGEASYAAHRTDPEPNWTSAHFYVDPSGPLGSLHLDVQAWAAYGYANSHGWHLEMCGTNAGTPHAVPAATIAHTAALTRRLCDAAGIPLRHLSPVDIRAGKRGICGHYDITRSHIDGNTHTDPGPAFDWSRFIQLVRSREDDIIMAISNSQQHDFDQLVAHLGKDARKSLAEAVLYSDVFHPFPGAKGDDLLWTQTVLSRLLNGQVAQMAAIKELAKGVGQDPQRVEQAIAEGVRQAVAEALAKGADEAADQGTS